MNRKVLIAVATLMLGTTAHVHAEDLVIGFTMAKTGPFVSLATTNEIAVDMAVDEINAAGGVNGSKLKVVKFDSAGDPKQSVLAVQQFAQDNNALAVVGPFSSSEARVAFATGERLGIVQMSMSSSAPGIAAPFKFAFRNTVDEGLVIGTVLKAMIAKKQPTESAAIAYATDDAVSKSVGTAVLPGLFTEAKIPLKGSVDFQYKAFDLSPQVSQLAQMKADVIGFGAPPEAMINLAKEMKRQGVTGRLIAGTTVADPDLPARFGDAGEGTLIGTSFYDELNDATRKFVKDFSERATKAGISRKVPNQSDASSYDIVYMYAEAMKKGKVTGNPAKVADERSAIRDQLRAQKDLPTIEGKITFGDNGDSIKPIYVIEARGGRWNLFDASAAK
ncbi:MAG: transporter substrate-binding protein [Tardiphaga sp.]|nr:transporter substrate-binding protein [Tardiphaga sp.]